MFGLIVNRVMKWNMETRKYDLSPDLSHLDSGSNVKLFTPDMDEQVNCISCNSPMTFGNGYTSRVYHNPYGFGFPVCHECYQKEKEEEYQFMQKEASV